MKDPEHWRLVGCLCEYEGRQEGKALHYDDAIARLVVR